MRVNQYIKTKGIHQIHFSCTTNPLRVYNKSIKGIHKIHVRQNAVAKSQYINLHCLNHVIMRVYGCLERYKVLFQYEG